MFIGQAALNDEANSSITCRWNQPATLSNDERLVKRLGTRRGCTLTRRPKGPESRTKRKEKLTCTHVRVDARVILYIGVWLPTDEGLRDIVSVPVTVELAGFRSMLVHTRIRVVTIGASTWFLDQSPAYMEAAAPLAAVDSEVIAFADMTSRSVP